MCVSLQNTTTESNETMEWCKCWWSMNEHLNDHWYECIFAVQFICVCLSLSLTHSPFRYIYNYIIMHANLTKHMGNHTINLKWLYCNKWYYCFVWSNYLMSVFVLFLLSPNYTLCTLSCSFILAYNPLITMQSEIMLGTIEILYCIEQSHKIHT